MVDKDMKVDADAMSLALGKFTWNFNGLDNRLNYLIGLLVNSADIRIGELVGAAMMVSFKRKLINALIGHHFGEEKVKEYSGLHERLGELIRFRNFIAHAENYFFDGELEQSRGELTNTTYDPQKHNYSPDEISDWAVKTTELETTMWKYIEQLYAP